MRKIIRKKILKTKINDQEGANVLFFTFINPATMDVPAAFQKLGQLEIMMTRSVMLMSLVVLMRRMTTNTVVLMRRDMMTDMVMLMIMRTMMLVLMTITDRLITFSCD